MPAFNSSQRTFSRAIFPPTQIFHRAFQQADSPAQIFPRILSAQIFPRPPPGSRRGLPHHGALSSPGRVVNITNYRSAAVFNRGPAPRPAAASFCARVSRGCQDGGGGRSSSVFSAAQGTSARRNLWVRLDGLSRPLSRLAPGTPSALIVSLALSSLTSSLLDGGRRAVRTATLNDGEERWRQDYKPVQTHSHFPNQHHQPLGNRNNTQAQSPSIRIF